MIKKLTLQIVLLCVFITFKNNIQFVFIIKNKKNKNKNLFQLYLCKYYKGLNYVFKMFIVIKH